MAKLSDDITQLQFAHPAHALCILIMPLRMCSSRAEQQEAHQHTEARLTCGYCPVPLLQTICCIAHVLTPELQLPHLQLQASPCMHAGVQVKLGTPIFIPNGQIGLFGSVTQLKSLVRNRKDLFDISVAGPLASGGASLAIFLTGLALSGGSAARVRGSALV